MCTCIQVDGREISSLAALRDLVGADNVVFDAAGYPPGLLATIRDCCLCSVNVMATAARAGYACEYTVGDWVWTPAPLPEPPDAR